MSYHLKHSGQEIDKNLDLAGTALQEHQDISHLATKEELAEESKRINAIDTASQNVAMDVAKLTGTGEGSVIDIVAREIAKVVANAPAALDTLEEIANFIIKDASQASKIIETIATHSSKLDYLDENFKKIIIMEESEYDEIEDKDETSLYMLF